MRVRGSVAARGVMLLRAITLLCAAFLAFGSATGVRACTIVSPRYRDDETYVRIIEARDRHRQQAVRERLAERDVELDLAKMLVPDTLVVDREDGGDCGSYPGPQFRAEIHAQNQDIAPEALYYHLSTLITMREQCNAAIGGYVIRRAEEAIGEDRMLRAWRYLMPLAQDWDTFWRFTRMADGQIVPIEPVFSRPNQRYLHVPEEISRSDRFNRRQRQAHDFLTVNPQGRALMASLNRIYTEYVSQRQGDEAALCPADYAEQQRLLATLRRR